MYDKRKNQFSELGAYLTDPEHAPAGTKRLANLIHSHKWQAHDIEAYFDTIHIQPLTLFLALANITLF